MSDQRTRLGLQLEAALEASLQLLFTSQLVSPLEETEATQQRLQPNTRIKPTRLGRACIQARPLFLLRNKFIFSFFRYKAVTVCMYYESLMLFMNPNCEQRNSSLVLNCNY
jgi:hypothetical protein